MTEAEAAAAAISDSRSQVDGCIGSAGHAQTAAQQLASAVAGLGTPKMAAALGQMDKDVASLISTLNGAGTSAEAALASIEEFKRS